MDSIKTRLGPDLDLIRSEARKRFISDMIIKSAKLSNYSERLVVQRFLADFVETEEFEGQLLQVLLDNGKDRKRGTEQ